MFHKIENVIDWVSIPVLLIGASLSYLTASYGPLLGLAICMGGIVLAGRAVQLKRYFLASGFIAIVAASSPLPIASRLFLLMGLASIGVCATVFAAFRTRPEPAA